MKSPTSPMAPGIVERPLSAKSVRQGGRQPLQLQLVKNRRVYAAENQTNTVNRQVSNSTQDLKSPIFNWSTDTINGKMADIESKNVDEENFYDPNNAPLRHITFKQIDKMPVEVQIRCIFLRVGEIDTLNERYYAEILLEASWEDSKFKSLPKKPFNPATNWTPQLELMNGIGELQDNISYSVHYDRQGIATITEHHRLKGTLWERMELQYFPFDIQDLSISITTSHSTTEMVFVKNLRKLSGVNRRVFTDEQEWYLFEHVDIEVTEQIEEHLEDGNNHSVVVCSSHAARKYGYFMWNAYFLIFLITSASFTTFPIPVSVIQGRVQIACTLLLTSITFRWLCNKALPTISYLTAVDVYAIGSIFSLCLLNIYHGVIGYVNYYVSTKPNDPSATITAQDILVIDRWALVVSTIVFFAYQFATLIWMYLVPWKTRRTMFRKDRENRKAFAEQYGSDRTTFMDILRAATFKRKTVTTVSTISDVEHSGPNS